MKESEAELLQSGKAGFKIQVPYQLLETGKKEAEKPLIVYLHGFGKNIKSFKTECIPMLGLSAYHLFIQGPYPLYDRKGQKKVEDWGRAWYMYDGEQEQFRVSLDHASRFIRQIIQRTTGAISSNRTCIIGFSMGGYLAGYHAIHNPEQVNELIMYGARFKSELLIGDYRKISHQNILALHGIDDNMVEPAPQRKEMEVLRSNGVDATFVEIEETHTFSNTGIERIIDWLSHRGYN
ncbi:hypothetical protein DYD21_12240 [Rhodohalobacter sp. SW132]|uniref:alpha/beta hydrolase n=1 Tax=Rhodohalobacter sp. SW132 TaxID=2293433 RepID=UPI000E226F60|nr:dienelactone hydrolase family protein [Rhodohalobacter sp. SW132]REL33024.1 hypothetical protein DYD21_12240 [Rhodohalobacter sp. SW132]